MCGPSIVKFVFLLNLFCFIAQMSASSSLPAHGGCTTSPDAPSCFSSSSALWSCATLKTRNCVVEMQGIPQPPGHRRCWRNSLPPILQTDNSGDLWYDFQGSQQIRALDITAPLDFIILSVSSCLLRSHFLQKLSSLKPCPRF